VVVSTDGSLLVSIGGRKTRGAVYRIEFVGQRNAALIASNLDGAGRYSRPGSAHRATAVGRLVPRVLGAGGNATRLGTIHHRASDNRSPATIRIRAIDILTQLNAGLPPGLAFDLARDNSPEIRARRRVVPRAHPTQNYEQILIGLSRDNEPLVRRAALDAILDRLETANASTLQQAANANLNHPDKRVRQAAARLASFLPSDRSRPAQTCRRGHGNRGDARAQPPSTLYTTGIVQALSALDLARGPSQQLEAIRIIIAALGD